MDKYNLKSMHLSNVCITKDYDVFQLCNLQVLMHFPGCDTTRHIPTVEEHADEFAAIARKAFMEYMDKWHPIPPDKKSVPYTGKGEWHELFESELPTPIANVSELTPTPETQPTCCAK